MLNRIYSLNLPESTYTTKNICRYSKIIEIFGRHSQCLSLISWIGLSNKIFRYNLLWQLCFDLLINSHLIFTSLSCPWNIQPFVELFSVRSGKWFLFQCFLLFSNSQIENGKLFFLKLSINKGIYCLGRPESVVWASSLALWNKCTIK